MRPTVLEKINPFIKVVTILVCGILMALTSSWKLNLAVLIAALLALLLLSNCKLSSLVKTFVPVILLAGAVFVSGMSYGKSAAQSASIYDVASMDSALLLQHAHSRLCRYGYDVRAFYRPKRIYYVAHASGARQAEICVRRAGGSQSYPDAAPRMG